MASTTSEPQPTGIQPTISLEAAVDLLVASLSCPLTTPSCANLMCVAARRISRAFHSRETSSPAQVKFSKSLPRLLRATISFITCKRTYKLHSDMVLRLASCRCTQNQSPEAVARIMRLHAEGPSVEDDPQAELLKKVHEVGYLREMVTHLIPLVKQSISSLTGHKFRSPVPGKDERDQPWPLSAEDLLPHGLPDSIEGLEMWSDARTGTSAIFGLVRELAMHHRPFALALLRPPEYTLAIDRPLEHLTAAMDFYDAHSASDPEVSRQPEFQLVLALVFQFFYVLRLPDPSNTFEPMLVAKVDEMAPVLERLSAILSSLLDNPSALRQEDEWNWSQMLLNIQALIYGRNGRVAPPEVRRQTDKLMQKMMDPVRDALSEMAEVRKGHCANMRCPRRADLDIVYSGRCANCNIMRYCGKECQKKAWNAPILPHKKVCNQIHEFKRSLSKETWAALWSDGGNVYWLMPRSLRTEDGKPVDAQLLKEINKSLVKFKAMCGVYDHGIAKGLADANLMALLKAEEADMDIRIMEMFP
ncbi:hypothetical protein D9611_003040 [Ephemerocybe angulata]|uniref:MYND-type domain-containing protein n=1 Tax=Ephemerocybe angulata TaxID=980116 RepID=A0A8H5FHZ3_9AGAR|nr:hypothetical protein D9611_003040 [Tulosesus angulatus]